MTATILSSIGTWIAGIGIGLIAVVAAYLKIRDGGKQAAQREAKERDNDSADEIRRRVDAAKRQLAADDRHVDERLRELGGLRDGD